ncbi:hypothetical protein IK112_02435 [Candidatus Saccharibacteria bacterium]|nr:hypothetical protein [Candidatus Saccharibacteria bacterium]
MQDDFTPQSNDGNSTTENSSQNPFTNSTPNFQPGPTPTAYPPSQSSTSPNIKLVILSVFLGVIALASIIVVIWLLTNRSQNTTTSNTTPTTPTTIVDKTAEVETFGFYTDKIANPTPDVIYRLSVHRATNDGNGVFGAYINADNTAVDLYIYWSYISNFYNISTDLTERELKTISFNQPVIDLTIGETGQDVNGDVLLFLLADGSVEYMPIVDALEKHSLKSYGQLAGVADVIKFYRVDAVGDTGDWRGYISTLAQRKDGSIIDLQNFMKAVLAD